jgi:hypothetical protein
MKKYLLLVSPSIILWFSMLTFLFSYRDFSGNSGINDPIYGFASKHILTLLAFLILFVLLIGFVKKAKMLEISVAVFIVTFVLLESFYILFASSEWLSIKHMFADLSNPTSIKFILWTFCAMPVLFSLATTVILSPLAYLISIRKNGTPLALI